MQPSAQASTGPLVTDGRPRNDVAELAHAYGRQVFHAAWRVLGDAALAEDVQQDVFVRLLEAPALPDVASWPAWLTATASRLAIDRLRRQRRWWRLLPFWQATAPASAPSAEQHADDAERARRLRDALARLKPREAECFVLRHLHDLDLPAIAAAMDISANNASVILHRATRALEARLAEPTDQRQGARS